MDSSERCQKCPKCDEEGLSASELMNHYSAVHLNYFPFGCHHCPVWFASQDSFSYHFTREHQGLEFVMYSNQKPSAEAKLEALMTLIAPSKAGNPIKTEPSFPNTDDNWPEWSSLSEEENCESMLPSLTPAENQLYDGNRSVKIEFANVVNEGRLVKREELDDSDCVEIPEPDQDETASKIENTVTASLTLCEERMESEDVDCPMEEMDTNHDEMAKDEKDSETNNNITGVLMQTECDNDNLDNQIKGNEHLKEEKKPTEPVTEEETTLGFGGAPLPAGVSTVATRHSRGRMRLVKVNQNAPFSLGIEELTDAKVIYLCPTPHGKLRCVLWTSIKASFKDVERPWMFEVKPTTSLPPYMKNASDYCDMQPEPFKTWLHQYCQMYEDTYKDTLEFRDILRKAMYRLLRYLRKYTVGGDTRNNVPKAEKTPKTVVAKKNKERKQMVIDTRTETTLGLQDVPLPLGVSVVVARHGEGSIRIVKADQDSKFSLGIDELIDTRTIDECDTLERKLRAVLWPCAKAAFKDVEKPWMFEVKPTSVLPPYMKYASDYCDMQPEPFKTWLHEFCKKYPDSWQNTLEFRAILKKVVCWFRGRMKVYKAEEGARIKPKPPMPVVPLGPLPPGMTTRTTEDGEMQIVTVDQESQFCLSLDELADFEQINLKEKLDKKLYAAIISCVREAYKNVKRPWILDEKPIVKVKYVGGSMDLCSLQPEPFKTWLIQFCDKYPAHCSDTQEMLAALKYSLGQVLNWISARNRQKMIKNEVIRKSNVSTL